MVSGEVTAGSAVSGTISYGQPPAGPRLNAMVSAFEEALLSRMAWRSVPGPLLAVLVTVMTLMSLIALSSAPRSGRLPTVRGPPSWSVAGTPPATKSVPLLSAGEPAVGTQPASSCGSASTLSRLVETAPPPVASTGPQMLLVAATCAASTRSAYGSVPARVERRMLFCTRGLLSNGPPPSIHSARRLPSTVLNSTSTEIGACAAARCVIVSAMSSSVPWNPSDSLSRKTQFSMRTSLWAENTSSPRRLPMNRLRRTQMRPLAAVGRLPAAVRLTASRSTKLRPSISRSAPLPGDRLMPRACGVLL